MDSAEIKLPHLDPVARLRAYGLNPKKGLGQNFLADDEALRQIIQAAEITPQDCVLEVGPGIGHLTRYLAQAARQVVAVELDSSLIPLLQEVLGKTTNVRIVQGDIMKQDIAGLVDAAGYLVVANIPYNITGPLMQYLLEARLRPTRLVLTIQKEVAAAICAEPGDLSIRALSVQVYGKARVTAHIPADSFFPAPDVDSAVLRVDLYPKPLIPADKLDIFFRLIKAGFSQKRKTMRNSLAGGLGWKPERAAQLLESVAVDPQRRAETLNMEEWEMLTERYASA